MAPSAGWHISSGYKMVLYVTDVYLRLFPIQILRIGESPVFRYNCVLCAE